MLIPLIVIPVKSYSPLISSFDKFTFTIAQIIKGEVILENSPTLFTFQNILTVLFIIISTVFFIRFTINILRIARKIVNSKKISYQKITLVLINEKSLPYSFLRYVFVNKSDFENDKIEKELLIHEEAHCFQYHSIDIIIVEFLNIFLWFNPAIWLFKKAIFLNHEFYADNRVMIQRDPIDYQQLLLNILLHNNSNYLVSNFEYSLIKNRIDMMTKSNPSHSAILRKISAITLFMAMTITITFSQEIKKTDKTMNFEKEWWYPILKKHNVKPHAFNNFRNIFEMGETNSIKDGVCTLTNAFVIIRDSTENYSIIESPLLYHDFNKELIITNAGTVKMYKTKSISVEPYTVIKIDKMELHVYKN